MSIDLGPVIVAVETAVELCMKVQKHYLSRQEKKDHEPVTIADYGVQAILCRTLSMEFPNDGVVAEESATEFQRTVPADQQALIARLVGDILGEPVSVAQLLAWLSYGQERQATRTWIIDPIDGTKGFLNHRHYAIAIGAVEGSQAVAGVLGCPNYGPDDGRIFYAVDGQAFYRSLDSTTLVPIQVSGRKPPDLKIVEGMESARVDQEIIHYVYQRLQLDEQDILRADGQDKYAMIACGDGDLYLRIPGDHERRAFVWDHAAGVAILHAAGGRATDLNGHPLDFNERPVLNGTKFVIITGGDPIHDEIIATLQELDF